MKKLFIIASLLLASAATAMAHHSFAAEFDGSKTLTIKGVVTSWEWMNPHAYIYMDVTDATGKKVNWGLQSRNLSVLKRQGLTRTTLKPGDEITVEISHHKDPAKNVGFVRYITKSTGQKFDLRPGQGTGILPETGQAQ